MIQTIKIVGVSGSGKSTLIREFMKKHPNFLHMSFGQFMNLYGSQAEERWNEQLKEHSGIVLIDDHLEWGHRDFVSLYKRENTLAILIITADIDKIYYRRKKDQDRIRDMKKATIDYEQKTSTRRALYVANSLNIPVCRVHSASVVEAVEALENLVSRATC